MKKYRKWIITIIGILVPIVWITITVHKYFSISKGIHTYKIKHYQSDTLRIAFIGDSWAYYHHQHPCTIESNLSSNLQRPVKVMSAGILGATSKIICTAISTTNSIHKTLKDGAPDYCIVSAGINDANLKIGQNFYQHHIHLIIDFLLQNHIVPVILEIPDYDIEYVYNKSSFKQKLLRRFSMLVTGSSLDCRKEYRQSLQSMLELNGYKEKVIVIEEKKWNPTGFKDSRQLYQEDGIHLNHKGYKILDYYIIQAISKDYFAKNGMNVDQK